MAIELEIKGLDNLAAKLEQLGVTINDQAGNALRAEAEIEMTEAKQRTPVWKPFRDNAAGYSVPNQPPKGHTPGQLRASGHVEGPDEEQAVRLIFGGPAIDYAIYVHEDLEAEHATGQAKFLESVVTEAAPHLAERIAERLKRTMGF